MASMPSLSCRLLYHFTEPALRQLVTDFIGNITLLACSKLPETLDSQPSCFKALE